MIASALPGTAGVPPAAIGTSSKERVPRVRELRTSGRARMHLEPIVTDSGPLPSAGVASSPPEGRWPAPMTNSRCARGAHESHPALDSPLIWCVLCVSYPPRNASSPRRDGSSSPGASEAPPRDSRRKDDQSPIQPSFCRTTGLPPAEPLAYTPTTTRPDRVCSGSPHPKKTPALNEELATLNAAARALKA